MSKKKPVKTAKDPQGAPRSMGRKLAIVLALLLLSAGATAGGLALAMGPSQVLAMLTGGTDEATDPANPDDPGAPKNAVAGAASAATADGKQAAGTSGMQAPASETSVMPFKEIIVNITATTASGRRTSRFLKLNLALVYDTALDGAGQVEARKLYMRDAFQDYLRQLTERDLQGTQGLLTVKEELLRRARAVAGNEAPREMLVADLIVQ